jgi:hypothetical protein
VIAFLISRGGALPSKPCTLIYTALGAHSNTILTTVYTHPTFLSAAVIFLSFSRFVIGLRRPAVRRRFVVDTPEG